eukprot:g21722.t1
MLRFLLITVGAMAAAEELHAAFDLDDDCQDEILSGLSYRSRAPVDNEDHINDFFSEEEKGVKKKRGGWGVGGDKLWGSGRGVEDINGGNVGYYNSGMYAAKGRCGGSGCALIVNPPGHRSINQFHIHFVHYAGYGANLKRRLEDRVCGKSGWHSGGLPCHGKAIFKSGFPAVFSTAMGGGGLRHASVIAWPQSCGGSGTIVQLAYGCSIEHQIRCLRACVKRAEEPDPSIQRLLNVLAETIDEKSSLSDMRQVLEHLDPEPAIKEVPSGKLQWSPPERGRLGPPVWSQIRLPYMGGA